MNQPPPAILSIYRGWKKAKRVADVQGRIDRLPASPAGSVRGVGSGDLTSAHADNDGGAMKNRALMNLQKRLEGLELEHLRQLAVELHERLEQAEAAAEQSAESAEFWQRHAMDLQEALHDDDAATHKCVGLTKAGELMVVRLDA